MQEAPVAPEVGPAPGHGLPDVARTGSWQLPADAPSTATPSAPAAAAPTAEAASDSAKMAANEALATAEAAKAAAEAAVGKAAGVEALQREVFPLDAQVPRVAVADAGGGTADVGRADAGDHLKGQVLPDAIRALGRAGAEAQRGAPLSLEALMEALEVGVLLVLGALAPKLVVHQHKANLTKTRKCIGASSVGECGRRCRGA